MKIVLEDFDSSVIVSPMSKKITSKGERGFTQVGLPVKEHDALQAIADDEGTTRCGFIKTKIRPLILKKLRSKK